MNTAKEMKFREKSPEFIKMLKKNGFTIEMSDLYEEIAWGLEMSDYDAKLLDRQEALFKILVSIQTGYSLKYKLDFLGLGGLLLWLLLRAMQHYQFGFGTNTSLGIWMTGIVLISFLSSIGALMLLYHTRKLERNAEGLKKEISGIKQKRASHDFFDE